VKQKQMTTTNQTLPKIFKDAKDFMPLNGTDYVEFYVSNAKQAAYFYKAALGFQSYAYAGLETGLKEHESYVVAQGKIKLMFTSPLKSNTFVGKHIDKHGDGIKVVALWVDNAIDAYHTAIEKGARSYMKPIVTNDDDGTIICSGIHTYGETVHVFIERTNYRGHFMPGFIKWQTPDFNPPSVGLKYIDHMVGNVALGEMNKWVNFYEEVMGFTNILTFDDKDISTEYTALMSKVVCNGNGRIKFPINEPAKGIKRSQVDEYLDFYEGEGVQHLAVATDDIVMTVREMRNRGIEFLPIPDSYYETVLDRVGKIDEDIKPLKELGILIDRDDEGYLLQIFTKPIEPRPTLFFEIIQRKGAQSFGKGNFKALFQAIEREQTIRGTL
jgi:4-hydroxyphenylpyruvate dioxygenase